MAKTTRLLVLLLAVIMLSVGAFFLLRRADHDGVSAHGALSVKDGRLVDEAGKAFQLRGYSTHGIGWFGEYINRDAMLSIRNAGGNVMRIAMYTEASGGYLEDRETNLALVNSAIGIAKDLDMYVIVDWHILEDGDPTEYQEQALAFFSEIAACYRDDPAVIYEICNEPNGVSWDTIRSYGEKVCAAIREFSPHALIILGTPSYSGSLNPALLNPLDDPNLMYAFHYYAGQHKDFEALRIAVEKQLPVFVSEWGVNTDENGDPALDEAEAFAEYLNAQGISWCAWSLCNKDEVFSALKPECDKLGEWEESDLTEVGKLMFQFMEGGRP